MKNVIRYGVFETNSSSSHSLCVCTKEEYEKFKKGDLVLDIYESKLIPRPEDFEKYNVFEEIEVKKPKLSPPKRLIVQPKKEAEVKPEVVQEPKKEVVNTISNVINALSLFL